MNRVRQSSVYRVITENESTPVADYHENFTYDGNGNIDSANRYKAGGVLMDSLAYNYNLDINGRLVNNQLNYITNANTVNNWPYGVTSQRRNNYTYDATGNMISDIEDSLQHIGWTVYGKIQNIQKNSRPLRNIIDYSYDAAGNRVMKSEGSTSANNTVTYYIRDAQGNPLALYERIGNSPIARPVLQEMELFGSSRLGRWRANVSQDGDSTAETAAWDTVGKKEYELTNHLGNVWATITDKRIQHSSGRTVDYFEPDVSTAQEYYAFGGLMPQRTYSYGSSYRYGFNGKENDNEVMGTGNQIDYGDRADDPRVGRFSSVDRLRNKYPELSSYQFGGDNPIENIDLDGEEPKKANQKVEETWYGKAKTNTKDFFVGAYTVIVYALGAMSEIPGQMHYGDRIKKQDQAEVFPLTHGQNFASLAFGSVEGPILAIAKVANYPTDAKAWGELTGIAILYKGAFREGPLVDEYGPQLGVLKDANFAQIGINKAEVFSPKGQEIYSKVSGTSIKTVGDLVKALQEGKVLPSQLPVDYVRVNGTKVILNTRTATTLSRAGIPQSKWFGVDKTGVAVPGMSGIIYDDLAKKQTKGSGLPPTGTSTPPN